MQQDTAPEPGEPSRDGPGQVTRGSVALASSIVLNALGGLAFWFAAARLVSIDEVGRSSALFQSLLFVNFVANLGLPVLVGHAASGRSQRAAMISNAATAVRTLAAVIGGLVFLAIAWTSDLLAPLVGERPVLGALAFVVLSVGAGLAVLFEVRLIALREWGLVVARAGAVAVSRLPVLFVVAAADDTDAALLVFLLAAVPVAASGYLGVFWLRATVDRPHPDAPRWPEDHRELRRYSLVNWFGLLSTQGPIFAVPVIVAFSVPSAENASFYVAWSFGAIVFLLPQMVGQVVLSEASVSTTWINDLFEGLRIALALTMVAALVAQFGGGLVSDMYGPDYGPVADQLPLVVAAGIGWSYTSLGLAAARVRERHLEVILISTVFVVSTLIPALIFVPRHGSDAAVWTWLAGTTVTAAFTATRYLKWRIDYGVASAHAPRDMAAS